MIIAAVRWLWVSVMLFIICVGLYTEARDNLTMAGVNGLIGFALGARLWDEVKR